MKEDDKLWIVLGRDNMDAVEAHLCSAFGCSDCVIRSIGCLKVRLPKEHWRWALLKVDGDDAQARKDAAYEYLLETLETIRLTKRPTYDSYGEGRIVFR